MTAERGRTARWLPGLDCLAHYERPWLRGDLLAGVTVAAYLLPQVMAYAEVAGLPAVTGLWAMTGAGLVYAVAGTSRQLSVGPESTTALMTAAAVGPLAAGDPGRYAGLAVALALIVGVLCLMARVVRLGSLADMLSRPVLVGYMAGIAALMITSQLTNLTGVPVQPDTFGGELGAFVGNLSQVHLPTLVTAAAVLAFLLVGAARHPRAPVPLLGMLLATAAVALLHLQSLGVEVIGAIPGALPTPSLPTVSAADSLALVAPAVGIAVVGYSDNVLTARAFAGANAGAVDGNQELLALGASNVAAGLVHGFPVSSSGSRTSIGHALGSRSQLYSLVAIGSVVVTLLALRPLLAAFPMPALGAVVVYAALRLIDVGEFRRLARFRRSELALALATTAGVLALGVLTGVLVAVGLSVADLLRRVARPHDAVLGFAHGVAGMHDVADYPGARLVPGLLVYRYDSPLFFANAENFRARALQAVDESSTPVEWFVLNAEAVVDVDITALDAIEQLRAELARRGVVFALARVKQELRADLAAAGLLERVGPDRVFMTLPTAVAAYAQAYEVRHGAPPDGLRLPGPASP